MLADLAQNTLDGLMLGSAYALLALGFTLIFGVLRRANLAYGPAIMLGAYAATWVNLSFRPGLFVLALVTIAGATLAGAYVERLCFAPHGRRTLSRDAAAIASMVGSFALWMQLEEIATLWLPKHLYSFPPLYDGPPFATRASDGARRVPGDACVRGRAPASGFTDSSPARASGSRCARSSTSRTPRGWQGSTCRASSSSCSRSPRRSAGSPAT